MAAAAAEPAALAEPSQENAWVRTDGWTVDSASWDKSARSGGIVAPVSTATHPSPNGDPAVSSSQVPNIKAPVASSSCTGGAARHRRSPYSHPAGRPLLLETVKMGAAAPGWPCSTTNAVCSSVVS